MTVPESYLDASSAFTTGADSPQAFLKRCLDRIETRESDILAFVDTAFDQARTAALASGARWRAGAPLSPIDGMPIGIKDVIETRDMATGMGSPLFADWRSGRDSASVTALREAGAIILAKTVTTEFAASVPGPTRNPHDLTRTPGGSSSGSAAAVAAGFIAAGLGTQVVGSILRPASFCGVVGVKPSLGAINRLGSHDFMSQSCQGVLAASLSDAWQVLTEIATRAGGDPGYPGLVGPALLPPPRVPSRLVVLETAGWSLVSDDLKGAFEIALRHLRETGIELLDRRDTPEVEALEAAITAALEVTRTVNAWESRWPLNIYRERDASKLSPEMLTRLAEAEAMTQAQYRRALDRRAKIRATYARLATVADACLTLSAPGAAPVGLAATGNAAFAVPSSLLGIPAVSLPVLAETGLPVGLQVMGFEQRDADLFAVARALDTLISGDRPSIPA